VDAGSVDDAEGQSLYFMTCAAALITSLAYR
jgi:hypothetical protein